MTLPRRRAGGRVPAAQLVLLGALLLYASGTVWRPGDDVVGGATTSSSTTCPTSPPRWSAGARAVLVELGCDVVQGYLLARPLPVPAFHAWLAENDARREDPRAATLHKG